ncbi:MAG: DegT/DnrJ/EryC1/StrS family aminotransferase [Burkholderiales bacterium]|nr:DegT/DnrJ/EryC1/StrS family aminotransferase [Anaerolineae bacterium]
MTPDEFQQRLIDAMGVLGQRKTRLVGRGASALWVALCAIAAKTGFSGEVILPDMICTAVLEAVLAAGFTPRLADIDTDTYTITPATVAPLLNEYTRVVIVAHLFGHAAPITALQTLAAQHGVFLIEDAVQGVGGHTEDTCAALGSGGDFAFVSFDGSKMIRGHGGLLLFDDDSWTPHIDQAIALLPTAPDTPTEQLLNVGLRDLYHGLGQSLRAGKVPAEVTAHTFRALLPTYAPLLLRSFDHSPVNQQQILTDWQTLPNRVGSRNLQAALLRKALAGLPIEQPLFRPGDAIWRYSVRFPSGEAADSFVTQLRESGRLVSHLYYPLNQLYAPNELLHTNALARRVVNLWVDEKAGDGYHALVHHVAADILL